MSDKLVNAETGELIATVTPDAARDLTDRIKTTVGVAWELIVQAYTGRAWAALGYANWDAYTAAEFGGLRLRLPSEERAEIVASLRDSGLSQRAIASAIDVTPPTVREDLRSGGRNLPPEHDRQPVEPAPSSADAPGGEPETGSEGAPATSDPAPPTTGIDGKEYPTPAVAAAARRRAENAYASDPTLTVRALAKLAGCSTGTAQSVINPGEPKPTPPKPPRPALAGTAEKAGWDFRKAVERLERIAADDRFPANREQVAAVLRGHLTYAVEVCQDLLDGFTTEPQEAP